MIKEQEIFTGLGTKVIFEDLNSLKKTLTQLDCIVENYNKYQRERYYLVHYLLALAENKLLRFPISVECVDVDNNMPDFKISSNGDEFILEATMATTEEYIKLMQGKFKNVGFFEYDSWIDEINDNVRITIREVKENDKLLGKPQTQILGTKIFLNLLSKSIIAKTKKLPSYNIEEGLNKELLVYYNFPPSGGINYTKAIMYLQHILKMQGYQEFKTHFDKIHILRDREIIFDILGDPYKISL